jgi:hypothetical protein
MDIAIGHHHTYVRPKLKVIGHFVRRPCEIYFKACSEHRSFTNAEKRYWPDLGVNAGGDGRKFMGQWSGQQPPWELGLMHIKADQAAKGERCNLVPRQKGALKAQIMK